MKCNKYWSLIFVIVIFLAIAPISSVNADVEKEPPPFGITFNAEWISKPIVGEKSTGIVRVDVTNSGVIGGSLLSPKLRVTEIFVSLDFAEGRITTDRILEHNEKAEFMISVDFPALDSGRYEYRVYVSFDVFDFKSSEWVSVLPFPYDGYLEITLTPFLPYWLVLMLPSIIITTSILLFGLILYLLLQKREKIKKEKPIAAFVLSLIGGISIFVSGVYGVYNILNPSFVPVMQGFSLAPISSAIEYSMLKIRIIFAVICGIVILLGAAMLYRKPPRKTWWGLIIIVLSIINSFTGSGFYLGSILGIIGGVLAFSWKPKAS